MFKASASYCVPHCCGWCCLQIESRSDLCSKPSVVTGHLPKKGTLHEKPTRTNTASLDDSWWAFSPVAVFSTGLAITTRIRGAVEVYIWFVSDRSYIAAETEQKNSLQKYIALVEKAHTVLLLWPVYYVWPSCNLVLVIVGDVSVDKYCPQRHQRTRRKYRTFGCVQPALFPLNLFSGGGFLDEHCGASFSSSTPTFGTLD